jgi:hypothetical protein
MESPIDPDLEAPQEQTHSDPIEIELLREDQDHPLPVIAITQAPETVPLPDADLHSDAIARLPETIGEQEPRLELEVHQDLEEMTIGENDLGHPETRGMSLVNGVLGSSKHG